MNQYQTFETWDAVLRWVGEFRPVFYHAPLDREPQRVHCEPRKRGKVRVFPMHGDADAFTADAGHLDRFKRWNHEVAK